MLKLAEGSQCVCIKQVVCKALDFNIVWYGQVLEKFAWCYPTFTDIRALKVMNMCKIITIYLNESKNYGKKNVVPVELGTGRSRTSFNKSV